MFILYSEFKQNVIKKNRFAIYEMAIHVKFFRRS